MKNAYLVGLMSIAASVSATAGESSSDDKATVTGFEYSGYLRASLSTTSSGGEQYCFGDGSYGYYVGRLGNECDTYGELGLSQGWKTSSGAVIKANAMLSVLTQAGAQANDYQSIAEPALSVPEYGSAEIALRQMNVTATGVFESMPEATLWAGKRYYRRKGVESMDFYYLNNSGYGAGIEGIRTGMGEFSAAVVNVQKEQLRGKNNVHGQRSTQNNILDLRLDNIDSFGNMKMDLAIALSKTDPTDLQDSVGEPDDTGALFTAELHGNVWCRTRCSYNRMVFQYGTDALGEAAFENQQGIKPETTPWWEGSIESAWRILNVGSVALTDRVDLDYVGYVAEGETITVQVPTTSPYNRSIILSPSYKWGNDSRTIFELGMNWYQPIQSTEEVDLTKVTIAHEFTFGLGMKSDPKIRAYMGTFFGDAAEVKRTGNRDGEDGTIVFGVQAVANW